MEKQEILVNSIINDLEPILYKHCDPKISGDKVHAGITGITDLVELIPHLVLEVQKLRAEVNDLKNCKYKCYLERQPEGRRTIIYNIKDKLASLTPVIINGRPTLLAEQIQRVFPECYEDNQINYQGMLINLIAILKDIIC